jgi:hypothetical protein
MRSVEWRGEIIVWVICDWCLDRQVEREAKEKERLEQWASRVCAREGCETTFTPARSGQRFCSDPCRWREHRRVKATTVSRNGQSSG